MATAFVIQQRGGRPTAPLVRRSQSHASALADLKMMMMVPPPEQQPPPSADLLSESNKASSIHPEFSNSSPANPFLPETFLPLALMVDEEEALQLLLDESTIQETPSSTISAQPQSLRHQLGLHLLDDGDTTILSSSSFGVAAQPEVVGHRGALYEYLENTREGFLRCAQLGCHAIELDVFVLPKDQSLVVFHGSGTDERPGLLQDYILGSDENGDDSRSILDLSYAETQQLQFNPDFAEFPCDVAAVQRGRIPLLEHVLTDLHAYPDIEIKIELKGAGTVLPVLELVERLQMQSQCSYSSFDLSKLQELRDLRANVELYRSGALFTEPPANYLELAQQCGATEIHLQYDQCNVERIQAIHAAGFKSMAWFRGPIGMASDTAHKYSHDMGNEDERCYQAVIDTGVQQLCCNRPDVLLQLLAKQGQLQQQLMVG